MSRLLRAVCVAALLLAFPNLALSEGEKEGVLEEAKRLYEEGKEHFGAGRYKEALEAFTQSYNLSHEQNLLYNLGSASEALGDRVRAIAFYELYLEEVPNPSDREEVLERIERLRGLASETEPVAEAVVKEGPPRETGKESIPEPNDDVDGEISEGGIFWPSIPLGGGALLLIGGTITGISAYKSFSGLESNCSPNCTEKEMKTSKNLALTTDILLAVGAAAVATGVVMWVVKATRKEKHEQRVWRPSPFCVEGGAGFILERHF